MRPKQLLVPAALAVLAGAVLLFQSTGSSQLVAANTLSQEVGPINYQGFVITPIEVGDGFISRIRRRDGKPFVIGHVLNREFPTSRFGTVADAIENAKSVASSATMENK